MVLADVILPIFLLVALGFALRRLSFIGEESNSALSRFVYYIAAPVIILRSTAQDSINWRMSLPLLFVIGSVTIALGFAVYALAARMAPARRGVFAQGIHRSNTVYVGLPILLNAYGNDALPYASVVIAFTVIVYGMLGVLFLTLPHKTDSRGQVRPWGPTLIYIFTNPLVLGCAIGLVLSPFIERFPLIIDRALAQVGQTAAPLGLISAGASLDFRQLRSELPVALAASGIKLLVYPALIFCGLYLFGFRGLALAVPVILAACPTAVVSAIMAREMRGDARLASAIVIGTTLASLVTLAAWLALLDTMPI